MEKQSGGEFASTDAAAGAQDAALQELWLSAEIPVEPCSRLQHLQRPTPSHLGSDTPDATRRGDENMARGRGSDVRIPVANGSTTLASPQRDNTDWSTLQSDLMDRVLVLPNECLLPNGAIAFCWD